jgi:hypothetical protein
MCESLPLDHASRGSGALNSALNGRGDSKPAGKLKSTLTPPPSSLSIGPTSSGSPTLPPFSILPESMLFAEVSPARMSLWLVPERASKEREAPSGPNSSDSFAKLGPDTSWQKTYQGCSQATTDGSWEEFSETWPPSGLMRSGECFLRPEWAHLTLEKGFLFWPTASSRDWKDTPGMSRTGADGRKRLDQLARVVYARQWATPQSRQRGTRSKDLILNGSTVIRRGSGERRGIDLTDQVGGNLNPTWVEWLMGFPLGWTALSASETPSSRKSRRGSGK